MIRERIKTRLVSFSGIDGAGKSTQIHHLKSCFEKWGFRVKTVVFWDEIAQLTRFRERAGHALFKGDKGVGRPDAPIHRRDKDVQSLPMTALRLVLYCVDAISAGIAVRQAMDSKFDLVIFDRSIYDELANLNLGHPLIRIYVRLIARFVPRPHRIFVLDADPVHALARKPEYPLEFLIGNRRSYLALSEIAGGFTIVPALSVEGVKQIVLQQTSDLFANEERPGVRISGTLSAETR